MARVVMLRVLAVEDAAELADALRAGAVAILPTDTVPGFSCIASAPAALARIRALKGGGADRAFVVLVGSPALIEPWLAPRQDRRAWRLLGQLWPAPLTAIVAVDGAPPGSIDTPAGRTLAVRVPAHQALREVLVRVGEPVVSTSVNAPGEAPLVDPVAIRGAFGGEVDLLVRGGAGQSRPSTLADCTVWPPRTVRKGEFDLDAILSAQANREGA